MSGPTTKQYLNHWLRGSAEALSIMRTLKSKKNYTFALFFGHLAIEKLLKAVCVVRQVPVPTTGVRGHDLPYIANQCGLQLTQQQLLELTTIKAFNIEGRYDDYKQRFHAMCTSQYTATWTAIIAEWCNKLRIIIRNEKSNLPNRNYLFTESQSGKIP